MNDLSLDMARRRYGYGRWDAPYWFIGPEEGMDRAENDDLEYRLKAWTELEACDLCDCREFHSRIGLPELLKWHREAPPPPLQSTWRSLMLCLMAFRGVSPEEVSGRKFQFLRDYQRTEWGMLNGETCVIELSGLAANSSTVPRNRQLFRKERIAEIHERIRAHKRPEVIVMYGWGEREAYERIADCSFLVSKTHGFPLAVTNDGSSRIAITVHPHARGVPNIYWTELGGRLRELSC